MPALYRNADPFLADEVGNAIANYIESDTFSTYGSATGKYVEFCVSRSLEPWPVSRWSFCMWLWDMASLIAMSSLVRVYIPAVKYSQRTRGEPWTLQGDQFVHRVIVALKKKYGLPGKKQKLALSLDIIWVLAQKLRGFPCLELMTHDDRLWVLAAVVGCMAMLRGGEFLTSPRQSRPILRAMDLKLAEVTAGRMALVVRVRKPKARWWESSVPVTIMGLPGTPLDVVGLFSEHRRLSRFSTDVKEPAFRLLDGSPLSKAWMFAVTDRRMRDAGISVVDKLGRTLVMGSKSFRAGGMRSARAANVDSAVIKATGRWTSDAYLCYDDEPGIAKFQDAASMMWKAVASSSRVEEGPSVQECVDVDAVMERESSGVSPHVVRLSEDMVPAVPACGQKALGSKVNTLWGEATVVSKAGLGYMCVWPHLGDDLHHMRFYEAGNAPAVGPRRRGEKRFITEVSEVV